MAERTTVTLTLEARSDDDTDESFPRARLAVRLEDTDDRPLGGGTITVSAESQEYEEAKPSKDHGLHQTFENVPIPCVVKGEHTGKESATVRIGESDIGGSIAN